MRDPLRSVLLLLVAIIMAGPGVQAATQYWDTDSAAGIQGGNAAWSTSEAKWSGAIGGTALGVWTNGNDARFVTPARGSPSTVTLTNSLNVGSVTMEGSVYTLIVTNGGQMRAGSAGSSIGTNAANNTVIVTGGGSRWDGGGQSLTIGSGSSGTNNALTIKNGAVVSNGVLNVGTLSASYNTVTVSNATLSTGGGNNFVGGQFSSTPPIGPGNRLTVLTNGTGGS